MSAGAKHKTSQLLDFVTGAVFKDFNSMSKNVDEKVYTTKNIWLPFKNVEAKFGGQNNYN